MELTDSLFKARAGRGAKEASNRFTFFFDLLFGIHGLSVVFLMIKDVTTKYKRISTFTDGHTADVVSESRKQFDL